MTREQLLQELRSWQKDFNEAWRVCGKYNHPDVEKINVQRNEILLRMLILKDKKVYKKNEWGELANRYYDLMMQAISSGNDVEAKFYEEKYKFALDLQQNNET